MNYYQQTLDIDREIGSKSGMAGALGNMANVLESLSDLSNARKKNEEGLALPREVGDQRRHSGKHSLEPWKCPGRDGRPGAGATAD